MRIDGKVTAGRLVRGARILVLPDCADTRVVHGRRCILPDRFGGGVAVTVDALEYVPDPQSSRARRWHVYTSAGVLSLAPAQEVRVGCQHCAAAAVEAGERGEDGRCWDHGGLSAHDRNLPECNATRVANGLEPWPIPEEVERRLAARAAAELAPPPVDLAAADTPAPASWPTPPGGRQLALSVALALPALGQGTGGLW